MGAGNWGEKSELQTRVESRQRGEGLLSLGTRREWAVEGGALGNRPRGPRVEPETISPRGGEACDGLCFRTACRRI